MDKKETRIEKSRGRARTVQERAKAWEELNKKILEKKAKADAEELEKENWVDEEEGMVEDAEIGDAPVDDGMKPQEAPLPEPVENEDEIL
jgi:hypothetical protein